LNDNDPKEWALDTVVAEEAVDFSQEHLGEMITSHRVVSEEEAFEMFREDVSYLKHVDDERIREIAITQIEGLQKK